MVADLLRAITILPEGEFTPRYCNNVVSQGMNKQPTHCLYAPSGALVGEPRLLLTTGHGPFSHQVLAIGYKLGRYQGDLGAYQTDVEIYVYDPNYPNTITTIKADPRRKCYYIKGKRHKYWRTYFVDRKYRNSRPAAR